MSRRKLVVKEYLDAVYSTRGEKTMLRNFNQGDRDGERSDYIGQHLGGLVWTLLVTP